MAGNWRIEKFPPVGFVDPGVLAYGLLLAMVLASNRAAQRSIGRGADRHHLHACITICRLPAYGGVVAAET